MSSETINMLDTSMTYFRPVVYIHYGRTKV